MSIGPVNYLPIAGNSAEQDRLNEELAGEFGGSAAYIAKAPTPTLVAATDTAALQALHDAMPATGGTIFLAAGVYALTNAGLAFSKPVRMVGAGHGFMGLTVNGDAANAYSPGGSVLQSNSATATGVTCTISGCTFADLTLVNISGVLPTAGYGVKLTAGTNAHVERLIIVGHFDGIVVENGSYYTLRDNFIFDIVRYGYFLRNLTTADSGDALLTGGVVTQTPATASRPATSAVRWESGGGLKVVGLKVNGIFATGLDFELAAGSSTSDILIDACSVENFTGYGIKCVAQGAGTLSNLAITGCEVGAGQGGTPVGIGIGASMRNGIIQGNAFSSLATGIEDLGGDGWGIGPNTFDGVTTPVQLDSTIVRASRIDVAPQTVRQDNVLVVSDNPAALLFANVQCDYRRDVPTTTGATVSRLWTLNVGQFGTGVLDFTVAGLVQGSGTYLIKRRRTIVSDGTGVVTVATPAGWTDIAAGGGVAPTVAISASGPAGEVIVTITLGGGGSSIDGLAHLQYDGQVVSLRQGT